MLVREFAPLKYNRMLNCSWIIRSIIFHVVLTSCILLNNVFNHKHIVQKISGYRKQEVLKIFDQILHLHS